MSKSADSTTEFIKKTCQEDPDTCFTIYGGDGTVFKAVNALMESGFQDRASLKIVPLGSGNDFVRSIGEMPQEFTSDVMRANDKYAINVINIGFDCSVVQRAQEFKKKPLVTGKMAYIMGVAGELMNKKPVSAKITLTYQDGKQEVIEQTIGKLKIEFPGIQIVAYRNGYIKTDEERNALIDDIAQKKPDVVFVAMGSPKQELLMEEMLQRHAAIYQGLGGSFDVYTGNVKRAPKWWVDHSLEWAYRLVKQPSRIKRQIHLVRFLLLVKLGRI
jgi:exopolysaccharide biosynthesis WecB/TagA/CpsF family protein